MPSELESRIHKLMIKSSYCLGLILILGLIALVHNLNETKHLGLLALVFW